MASLLRAGLLGLGGIDLLQLFLKAKYCFYIKGQDSTIVLPLSILRPQTSKKLGSTPIADSFSWIDGKVNLSAGQHVLE